MTIHEFAEQYRLKTRLDACAETIIPGRLGDSHIFVWSDDNSRFGVMIVAKGANSLPMGHCVRAQRELEAVGCECSQRAEFEGAWLFDPENPVQVKLAMRFARIRPKRVMSDAQREVLKRAFDKSPAGQRRKGTPEP